MLTHVFYVYWRLWEAHLFVSYVSWRLWEAHLYGFYVSGRVLGVPDSPALRVSVGPSPKNLRPEALRLAEACVLRVLEALGGSFVRVLRVWEAPAGSNL